MLPLLSFILGYLCATTSAAVLPRASAVHLAIGPQCGNLSSGIPADVNAGLGSLSTYKTIVAFGGESFEYQVGRLTHCVETDSYTGGGATNGPTWVQNLAASTGAKLVNYGSTGAVVDKNQWPQVKSVQSTSSLDFINQASQFETTQKFDPATTLYIIFFGIEDYAQAIATGKTDLNQIAGVLVYTLLGLTSSTNFAKNILIVDNYGLGKSSPAGESFKKDLFVTLGTGHRLYGWNVGFASFGRLWQGVLYSSPGYAAFGYTDSGTCVKDGKTCSDPAHTFYWGPGYANPSAATHAIMANYVEEVFTQCTS
ncbi:carbohydrate esterase family 16 protein [Mycena rebaudengoi]|nr:carbohydrate esterase family 16 protein [Mycena rebaudengoi]